MDERVKAFLERKQSEEKAAHDKEKQNTLIQLGLYEKEYSPDITYSEEYPCYENENTDHYGKYYKAVPLEVTDEEYQIIKKYAKSENDADTEIRENTIAKVLQVFSWILFICGFFAGIVFGNESIDVGFYSFSHTETKFMWSVALTYWCTAAVSGTILLGFAEIIKLLEAIKNK